GGHKCAYIVAMTSYAANDAREKCLAAGMDDYISKPVQLDALEKVLTRARHSLDRALARDTGGDGTLIDPAAIDVLRLLRRPDKPDPVAELIDMFVRETPTRLRAMQTAAAQYNAEALAIAAHTLRGCASSIGAVKLAGLCQKLEEHAERRAMQVAVRLVKKLELEFDRTRQALELEKAKIKESAE